MSRIAAYLLGVMTALVSLLGITSQASASYRLPDPYVWEPVASLNDTIPIEDRYGNFIEEPNNNPFDLFDPAEVIQDVEYDPISNTYIITEKIGNENYRPPTTMTFDEYMNWVANKEEADYFKQLAGASDGSRSRSGNIDPVAEVDVSKDIIDRLFGGTQVEIRPQGNVDLTFGVDYYRQDNPILPRRQQRNGPQFDFDMDIQVDVNGQIGEKLKTSFNYNTSRTFDFQNRLKIDYNSDLFSEDEILKNIEAGDVSLPLKSNLIKGSQSLFGIKTELQFGHLRLTAIASQQNSKQNSIKIEGGSVLQEFQMYADQYDENRHFFISHFNRNNFEPALKNIPQVNSLFRITRLEVWVTNDRNQTTDIRDIVAIADLGEWRRMTNSDPERWRNPDTAAMKDLCDIDILPNNTTNYILPEIRKRPETRDIDEVVRTLIGPEFNFVQSQDFERVQARRLQPTEYRYHPDLGMISLNIRLDQDEVLGVAYEYTYNGQVFQVGELSQDVENVDPEFNQQVLFVKMLKGTNQRVDLPMWDLMMKNVYRVSAGDIDPEEFELDVFWEDPGKGFKRFLPTPANLDNVPLLALFNLDKLNKTGDPQPDGKFDFVNGITINPQLGIVMFPVVEPFGKTIRDSILAAGGLPERFVYQQLYDSTVVRAREFPNLNRFTLKGRAKTSSSSDISLGAFNIPPGSVRVTAGGQLLKENEDYVIDYNIGRLKILNQTYLQPNTPINVSFEDNALFSFNRKTMLGLRADYKFNEHLSAGATYMSLFERPFTQKVNIGDDPINNRIYGLDMSFSNDIPFITKLVDKLPVIQTTAPSNVTFEAEVAALKPSHSRAIDKSRKDGEGVVYLDDFEGTASNFDLRSPVTAWVMSSTPQQQVIDGVERFRESMLIDSLPYGMNRALINWYRIDQGARQGNQTSNSNPYTRLVSQDEIFQNRTPRFGLNDFRTFDVSYYPNKRGPYNFDPPGGTVYSSGIDQFCNLVDPHLRWGGIMRGLTQVNFEQANIEALEFWMLDPFIYDSMGTDQGKIVFQLGNISEDILRDSRKFFEHGLPLSPEERIDTTNWGKVPRIPATVNAFSNNPEERARQDVGLDGLNDAEEEVFFADYLQLLRNAGVDAECLIQAERDPSNDNFLYFLDETIPSGTSIFDRYQRFNHPQGNSPPPGGDALRVSASTNIPDAEDINNDNSMSETEAYFEYVVQLNRQSTGDPNGNLNPNDPLITDRITTNNGTWYRFKIPLYEYTRRVGGIQDFRSIRFMRMFLTDFDQRTTIRFATLDLVRNQWRRLRNTAASGCGDGNSTLIVDAVNIEEHSDRLPFRYDIPIGIQRERITSSTYQDVFQNEQSLSLKYEFLNDNDSCQQRVYKNLDLDLRFFKRLQMFVHSEEEVLGSIPDGAVKLFIRLGSDYDNNYYEYEVPLVQSKDPTLTGDAYKTELWRPENEVEFALEMFTNLKIERNAVNGDLTVEYPKNIMQEINGVLVPRRIAIKGNPTLGYVRNVIIGVRNREGDEFTGAYNGEVWVNEMRMVGLEEKGGVAGLARLDADLADFGSVGLSGSYSSIGWGAIDQKLQDRSLEAITQFDVSTNLQLGKFFGPRAGIQIPFYYQYSQTIRKPKYDALDLDLLLKEKLRSITDQDDRDSVRRISQDFSSLRQFSFTNVRKDPGPNAKPFPWNISNFSLSYSYSRSRIRNEILEKDQLDQHRGGLDYTYTLPLKPIQPFKNISKSNWLKWLTEFNFMPLPNSFTFGTVLDRKFGERSYRFSDEIYKTWFDKRFTWDRTYNLRWDLTKSLKLTYNANNYAVVDEPSEFVSRSPSVVLIDPKVRNDSIWQNIKKFGRTKDYSHQLRATYSLPFKFIPILDFVRTDISYEATYGWKAAALNTDSLGNVIQNGQNIQASGELDLVKLYNKVPLLSKINKTNSSTTTNRQGGPNSSKSGPPGRSDQQGTQGNKSGRQGNTGVSPSGDKSADPSINDPSGTGATGATSDQDTGQSKKEKKQAKKDAKAADKADAKDKKKTTTVSPVLKTVLRPLMMIRKLRVNYSQQRGTTIPGFTPQSRLLGLSSGFKAPGWDFVTGAQPFINRRADQNTGDWLDKARSSSWITTNPFQNAQVLQTKTTSIDARLSIEPFTDFKVEVDVSKNITNNFSIFFKTFNKHDNQNDQIGRRSAREIGSFNMSYFSLPTLFMDDSTQIAQLFRKFETNRSIISKLRGVGVHEVDGPDYTEGFGRKQQDVLVPAFLAAYTGRDPENFEFTDMFKWLPSPNWTVNYNGLSKLSFLKNIFNNVRISHGYKSTLTINSFENDLSYDDYDEVNGVVIDPRNEANLDTISKNYYSRFLLPSVLIEEQFAPLIGIDVKTKNDMTFSFAYNKRRGLQMGFISYELAETRSTTVDFGFEWTMKNVRIGFLPGFNSQANKKKKSGSNGSGQGNSTKLGNDLNILFDLSLSDNLTVNHLLDQEAAARPTRGSKDITISPSLSYDVNKNINLRFFVDYRRQSPYVSNAYVVVSTQGGITVRVSLE